MKKMIVIQTRFDAIHAWENCPFEEVEFLKYPHRHEFWVKAKIEVTHNDRDLEFFMVKQRLNDFLSYYKGKDLGSTSCEMLAEDIIQGLDLPFVSVSVFEDGENGAEIEI